MQPAKMATVPILNWKPVTVFRLGRVVMMRQTAGHVTEGAELKKADSGKAQRRAAAARIRKMIRKCKADTKTIRQLDDEQTEYLERLRKHQ
jgi:hypothetical protein